MPGKLNKLESERMALKIKKEKSIKKEKKVKTEKTTDKQEKVKKSIKKEKKEKTDKKSLKKEKSDKKSVKKEKKSKSTGDKVPKRKRIEVDSDADAEDAPTVKKAKDVNALENFRISPKNLANLKAKGIESLFEIQTKTFDTVFDGEDLVGRAHTGSGKTLAFALPTCERMLAQDKSTTESGGRALAYGRAPRVLVVAPTRELAKQVATVFESVSCGLSVLTVYGGSAYGPQEAGLRRGVDVLVGTPGRINDFLEKKTCLSLSSIECIILDEADEMLNIGFGPDIEKMLETAPGRDSRQMLLFSATLPIWIKNVSAKYQKTNKKTVDLVGQTKRQASSSVEHYMMPVFWTERPSIIGDCIRIYGTGGRSIVFAETKKECNDLVLDPRLNVDCQVLHGDIAQAQRETTLKGFRDGAFSCLVATDVAARGLDISGVDLVVQCEPPSDVETYIHRSGRTGRAGKTGISLTLYTPKHVYYLQQIERKASVPFKLKGCPQPLDLLSAYSKSVYDVSDEQIKCMLPCARKLIADKGAEVAVAAALFASTGLKKNMKMSRSLLTGQDTYVTISVETSHPVHSLTFIWSLLRRYFDHNICDDVKGMRLRKDSMGAVCDIPVSAREQVQAFGEDSEISLATELPDIVEKAMAAPVQRRWGGGGSSRGRGGGGARNSGFGGRFHQRGGRGGRR